MLFMRQSVVGLRWWMVLPLAFAATLHTAGGNFPAFFSRYLLVALVAAAVLLPRLPPALAAELPEVLLRVGILRRKRS